MIKVLCTALLLSSPFIPVQQSLDEVFAKARRHSEAVDEKLLALKDQRDVAVWGTTLMNIIVEEPWVTARVLEDKLRRLNIDIYLLARPIDDLASKADACARLPYDQPGLCRPYALWIEVNGRERAVERSKTFGADEAQNLERLTKTGFLTLRRTKAIKRRFAAFA